LEKTLFDTVNALSWTLYGTGVVRTATATFVIQPVKRSSSLLLAIIAQDFLISVPVLIRELLSSQQGVEHTKINHHIPKRLAADRTRVMTARIGLEASRMHEMTTRKLFDRRIGGKQEVIADGAI
jgi:hypothetical protein